MRHAIKITLCCLAFSPPLFADVYRFVTIDVPDAIFTDARGINARGDIVGNYADADDVAHSFLLHEGVFTTIGAPDVSITGARAINATGDIVGRFVDADDVLHGYLLSDGQFTQIDSPVGEISAVFGINNAGDITGEYVDDTGYLSGFFLREGAFNDVRVPGSLSTSVYFAQDNGRVLVGSTALLPDGAVHGFVQTRSGEFQLIDVPGTRVPCTVARWINQRGDIVGYYTVVDSLDDCTGDQADGFILRDREYTRIDAPGARATKVLAINDDGVIVGNFTDRRGDTHGFKAIPRH